MKNLLTHNYVLKGVFILILGIALGLGGPYGTFEHFPILPRLSFWILILIVPWALWEILYKAASTVLPQELNSRVLMALLMPAFAVIGSAFVTGLSILLGYVKTESFLEEWPLSIVTWLGFSFFIILPLIFIGDELSLRQRKSGGSDLLNFLTEKLPEHLRGAQLMALKSEDHYLRVYTSAGDDLILMSMENAITALSGYPGIRTHRSWWAALDQFPLEIDQRKLPSEIQLLSGLTIPMSRRKAKHVMATLNARKKA